MEQEELLGEVKIFLGLTDSLQDDLLALIIRDATNSVQGYIGENYLPQQFERVVREISIVRYNRIGSEGVSQESEEGKSATYEADPLAPYYSILDKYIEDKTPVNLIAKATFL